MVSKDNHLFDYLLLLFRIQWNLSYLDPTYPDSRLTELWK